MTPDEALTEALAYRDDARLMRASHPVRMRETRDRTLGIFGQALGPKKLAEMEAFIRARPQEASGVVFDQLIDAMDLGFISDALVDSNTAISSSGAGNTTAFALGVRTAVDQPTHYLVDDALVAILNATDIDDDIPMRFIVPGEARLYVEFGRQRATGITIQNAESGDHLLEGAHIEVSDSLAHAGGLPPIGRKLMKVIFTGSPYGKSNALDDATFAVTLPIDDLDAPLNEALKRAIEFSQRPEFAFNHIPASAWAEARQALSLLVKCLLYIGMSSVRKQVFAEYSDAKKNIAAMKSGAKLAKAKRKMQSLCDYTLILPPAADPAEGDGSAHRTVATHWRRWHFRMQRYGPGNTLTKMKLINAVLVNPGTDQKATTARQYVVGAPR